MSYFDGNGYTLQYYIWNWWKRSTLHDIWWWFMHRFHPEHRYNMLKTGLSPGYYDPTITILYGVMNTFRYWYENDQWSHLKRDSDWDQAIKNSENAEEKEYLIKNYETKKELDLIYDWWVNDYLKIYAEHEAAADEDHDDSYWTQAIATEDTLENQADEMLARLMKHRQKIWYA